MVTLTVYIPAVKPVRVLVVTPASICCGVVFHVNVKVLDESYPELALTVVLPVLSPVHKTSVTESIATI